MEAFTPRNTHFADLKSHQKPLWEGQTHPHGEQYVVHRP
jgi:hypothetical protein